MVESSKYYHFIALPDLRVFANAGFPYSRMADLSDTLVVVPKAPTQGQVATPVSYTHLDVYKRQVREREPDALEPGQMTHVVNIPHPQTVDACLLYTSRCV